MSWTQFLTITAVVYLIYYSMNLLADILKTGKMGPEKPEAEELFFTDEVEPELVTPEEDFDSSPVSSLQRFKTGMLQATGGVGIRELFELAKNDLIEYTKAIPY